MFSPDWTIAQSYPQYIWDVPPGRDGLINIIYFPSEINNTAIKTIKPLEKETGLMGNAGENNLSMGIKGGGEFGRILFSFMLKCIQKFFSSTAWI